MIFRYIFKDGDTKIVTYPLTKKKLFRILPGMAVIAYGVILLCIGSYGNGGEGMIEGLADMVDKNVNKGNKPNK